jgi:hypothetical protein
MKRVGPHVNNLYINQLKIYGFEARSQNCEKGLLASSFPKTSAAVYLNSSVFWDVMLRRVVKN